jgi:hypothetical protein
MPVSASVTDTSPDDGARRYNSNFCQPFVVPLNRTASGSPPTLS